MNEIECKVKEIVCDKLDVPSGIVTNETSFKNDLGADSLDMIEVIIELEKEYKIDIPQNEYDGVETVGDIVEVVKKHIK